MSHLQSRKRPE